MPALPPFTVFDTETTGLDPYKGHKIIEIAAVRVENGKILSENTFEQLVNPERSIPPDAAQIHKINDDQVRTAPTIDQVLPKFLDFVAESILVAHNSDFDMSFLQMEKEHCWGFVELPECLCTMRLSRSLYPTEFRHSLDVVSQRLGVKQPAHRHRALPDVLITAEALLKMLAFGNINSIEDLRQKAGWKKLVA